MRLRESGRGRGDASVQAASQAREAPAGVTLADKASLEEALFRFLCTVRDGHAQALRPLLATPATLQALYAAPHPALWEAWRHCLDACMVQVSPDPTCWGTLQVSPAVLAMTLAVHNCLAPTPPAPGDNATALADTVEEFTAALLATIPVARNRDMALAYHAVLRSLDGVIPLLAPSRVRLVQALLERSPLTALLALDVHTPAAVEDLATELLPGWRRRTFPQAQVWPDLAAWLEVVTILLAEPLLARWLRHRWLALPESLPACRNVGLVLEALYRQGQQRAWLLEFYEAYDQNCRARHARAGQGSVWPLLHTIEILLRAREESATEQRLNHRGNAYFLKFYPLVQLIIAEQGMPTEYTHLSREFVLALRALAPYVTIGAQQRLVFSEVAFAETPQRAAS